MKTVKNIHRQDRRSIHWLLLLGILCSSGVGYTQKRERKEQKDTLAVLREFMYVSNAYQQVPFDLGLELRNSTNFVTGAEDTATMQAVFYLRKEYSYVRFGEFEQMVNDSMALLVSDKLQQMILYTNAGSMVNKVRAMMGIFVTDSTLQNMAVRYTSFAKQSPDNSSQIELQSRAVIFGTSLPKEIITLQYDTKKKTPQQVTTIKRVLVPVDSLHYSQLQSHAGMEGKLLILENRHFLVKERTATFIYKSIEHGTALQVPVEMASRIMRTEEGEYKPVKEYENYMLTLGQ